MVAFLKWIGALDAYREGLDVLLQCNSGGRLCSGIIGQCRISHGPQKVMARILIDA